MLEKKLFLCFWLSILTFQANAQQLLSGFVKDRETNEVIVGAVVKCIETNQNTASNNFGFYSLALPNL